MAECDKSIKSGAKKSVNSQFQNCYISPVKLFDTPKSSDPQLKAEIKVQQDQIKTLKSVISVKEKNHELDKGKLDKATKLLQSVQSGIDVSKEVDFFLNEQSRKRKVEDLAIHENKRMRSNEVEDDMILAFDTEQAQSTSSANAGKRKRVSSEEELHSLLKQTSKHEQENEIMSGEYKNSEKKVGTDKNGNKKSIGEVTKKPNERESPVKKPPSKLLNSKSKKQSKTIIEPVAKSKESISSVFDFEDDPYVLEIQATKKREAEKLAARTKIKTKGRKRESMARMAEFSQSLNCSPSSDESSSDESGTKLKILKLKKKEGGPSQKKINSFLKKDVVASKEKESIDELEEVCDYTPSIDELLKLPDRPEDGGKTMDEVLDDLDIEIAERKKKHEEEMATLDRDITAEKQRQEEWRERMKKNAVLRDRLEVEITESVLRRMFKENTEYLRDIEKGMIESSRHQAFHKSSRTRHALYYTMITDPFTDDQLQWTLEELGMVWMKTKREQMDNNEYIWKVLLAECFIKFYMDHFGLDKKETEKKISETPLRKAVEDSSSDDDML